VSFNFLGLAVQKFPFWGRIFSGSHFGEFVSPEDLQICPNNCLTNNFLHCEFQLSMLSSLKVSFLKGHFLGERSPPDDPRFFGQNNCLTNNFLHCEFQLSMFSSLKVLFLEGHFLGRRGRRSSHQEDPRFFGQNKCLTNNFLHCEFQLSMLSSLKVSFRRQFGVFVPPQRTPNLVKIIVLQTTSYIISFNFLRQAVKNGPFLGPHFWRGAHRPQA